MVIVVKSRQNKSWSKRNRNPIAGGLSYRLYQTSHFLPSLHLPHLYWQYWKLPLLSFRRIDRFYLHPVIHLLQPYIIIPDVVTGILLLKRIQFQLLPRNTSYVECPRQHIFKVFTWFLLHSGCIRIFAMRCDIFENSRCHRWPHQFFTDGVLHIHAPSKRIHRRGTDCRSHPEIASLPLS